MSKFTILLLVLFVASVHTEITPQDTADAVTKGTSGFFFQLLRETIFYNLNECSYYLYQVVEHYVVFSDLTYQAKIWPAILEFAKGVHKLPIAFYQCWDMVDEYYLLINAYNNIVFKSPVDSIIAYILNILFNGIDIYYEGVTMVASVNDSDWTLFGESWAKIFSDLFIKNPFMTSWTMYNSEVIDNYLTMTSEHSQWVKATADDGMDHEANAQLLNEVNLCLQKQAQNSELAGQTRNLLKAPARARPELALEILNLYCN